MLTAGRARWAVLGLFAAVRVAVWSTGGRFSMALLDVQPQLLDPGVLRAHPFGAAADVHIQPPLYNLLVGSVLRWSPLPDALSFQVLWVLCGAVIAVGVVELGRLLSGSIVVGLVAGAVVALDPYLLTFEHTLTYEEPVAAVLVVAAVALARLERERHLRWFGAFVAAVTLAVLARSIFHPLWLVAAVAAVLVLARPARGWRPWAVAAAGLLAVLVPVAANGVRYGEWGLSSFLGMNLQRSVTAALPERDTKRLVADGTLSPLAQVTPFSTYATYVDAGVAPDRCRLRHVGDRDQPALSDPAKASGFANFNAECFLPLYDRAQHDALAALRAEPGRFLALRPSAAALYLDQSRFAGGDSPVTRALARVWDPLSLTVHHQVSMRSWTSPVGGFPFLGTRMALMLAVAVALAAARGLVAALRLVRRRGRDGDLTWAFVGLTTIFVTIVGTTVELGENGRFRVLLDPLLLTVLVVAGARAVEVVRARRFSSAGPGSTPSSPRRSAPPRPAR